MTPRSSPRHAGGGGNKRPADGFRKRSSDLSLPDVTFTKRKRMTRELRDHDEVHQYVLQAAAKILEVPVERLLEIENLHSPTSGDSNSENHEISSNSSSNDHIDDCTPAGSSTSSLEKIPLPTPHESFSTLEKVPLATRSRLSRKSKIQSSSFGDNNPLPFRDQSYLTRDDMFQAEKRFDPPETNLFHAYPTPPDSQGNEMVMGDNNMWNNNSVPQFQYSQYVTQPGDIPPAGLLAPVDNLSDISGFSFNGYGGDMSFQLDQSLQNLDNLQYPGTEWNIAPSEPTQTSIDLFASSSSTESDSKSLVKEGSTKGRRRGPFRIDEQRQETGLTRRLGACIRCSMQRIRCVPDPSKPGGCCKTCIQASQSRTRWLPCLRYKITDTELLAHDVAPRSTWTTRWKKMELVDITNWASDTIKTIQCTQGVGNTSYSMQVRKFVPFPGDALSRRWKMDGREYQYECATYAVPNMRQAGKTLMESTKSTIPVAIKHWVNNQDSLLCNTYNMAYHYSLHAEREEDRSLLSLTLLMWNAARRMSLAAHICGSETLGMKKIDFGPNSTSTNKILLPPVYSAQMEIIFVTMILQPTKKDILDRLKVLVGENNRRSWLAIYLCIFLLLHSCALLVARDRERAKMQGAQTRFYRPRVMEEIYNGAKILLAYFHFCNRGSYPLHMDWTSADQIALTELKPEQIDFMRKNVKEYENKQDHFRYILDNDKYEDEYYFIAQLYDRDWKPRQMHHT